MKLITDDDVKFLEEYKQDDRDAKVDNFIYGLILGAALYIGLGTLLLAFLGCGTEEDNTRTRVVASDPVTIDHTEIQYETETVYVEKPEVPAVSFQGYYELTNGGYIELVELSDKRVIIYGAAKLYSKNFDGLLALHPAIPSGPHYIRNNKFIIGEYSVNYDKTVNDVEKDGTVGDITGVRKTLYSIQFIDDVLTIKLTIFSTTGLTIEAERVIKEIK
jgi:hypothetical protein